MKRLHLAVLFLAGGVALAGCGNSTTRPSSVALAATAPDLPAPGAEAIAVMTRNLYIGTDVAPVLQAAQTDPGSVPLALALAFQTFLHTSFPTRAMGIADEIAASAPHVVGLQEVTLVRIQDPADFQPFNATRVLIDFLAVLQAELAGRGLEYRAYAIEESDVELPMLTGFDPVAGPTFADLRVTDRDVLLVRADVQVANVASGHFLHLAPLFGPLPLLRGWIAADVTVHGSTYRVLDTHLEVDNPAVSGPQAQELVALTAGEDLPAILLGDFNSGPGIALDAYDALTGAGFVDLWTNGRSRGPGLTCCNLPDLSNPTTAGFFDQRIDLVLVRDGRFANGGAGLVGGAQIAVVGEEPGDRLSAPGGYLLWPSDHAGVVATLRVPPSPVVATR